jgi:hypothetical protein
MNFFKTLAVFLMLSGTAFAEGNKITILSSATTPDVKHVRVICVDGYKYLLVEAPASYAGQAIVQMFEKVMSTDKPQPSRCAQ